MSEPTCTYTPNPSRYDAMEYRRSGASGLRLPAVSLGLWHNFGDTASHERMRSLCFTAFDHGVTHFDLANNYGPEPGSAERNAGRILGEYFRGHRDELIVSTKAGFEMWDGPYGDWGSRKYLLASLEVAGVSIAIQAKFTIADLAGADLLFQPNFSQPINFIGALAIAATQRS